MTQHHANPSVTTDRVLSQVLAERIAQDAKWGEQNHPDGTGPRTAAIVGALCFADSAANYARLACQSAASKGETTWRLVFAEEALEALAEADPAKLRAELVQVAAVAVAWIEAIDRRTPTTEQQPLTAEELATARANVDHLNAEFPDEPSDGRPATEACGKCKRSFDPTDTAFDGRAQYAATPYCRHCVGLCHDNNSADHRCVICG